MSGTGVDELRGRLDSWVVAGLISADQAERIVAAARLVTYDEEVTGSGDLMSSSEVRALPLGHQ